MREGERFPCLFKGTSNAAAPGPWDPPAMEPARRSFTSTSTNTAGTGYRFTESLVHAPRVSHLPLHGGAAHVHRPASPGTRWLWDRSTPVAPGAGPPLGRRSATGAHLCSRCGTPFRMQVQDGGTPVLQVGTPSGHRSGQQGSAGHLPGVDFPCVCRFLARYSGKSESEGSRLRADARAPSLNDGRPE